MGEIAIVELAAFEQTIKAPAKQQKDEIALLNLNYIDAIIAMSNTNRLIIKVSFLALHFCILCQVLIYRKCLGFSFCAAQSTISAMRFCLVSALLASTNH